MFVDTRFPLDLSTGATASLEFQTMITRVDNGFETRNPRWNTPLRSYTLRTARSLQDLATLRQFYTVMRGRQRSFRFVDFSEYTSSEWNSVDLTPDATTFSDQVIGTGDGVTVAFQLSKTYTIAGNDIVRDITKPVTGSVKVGVNGVELFSPAGFTVDTATGIVTLASPAGSSQAVTAGFDFDVQVRFDTDVLAAQFVSTFELEVPSVVIRETRGD